MEGLQRRSRVGVALVLGILAFLYGVSARQLLPDSYDTKSLDVAGRQSKGQGFKWKPMSEELTSDLDVFTERYIGHGVQAPLIHRNAPSSPFRPINVTQQQLLLETILRDQVRIATIHGQIDKVVNKGKHASKTWNPASNAQSISEDFQGPVVSGLTLGSGEYFIRLSLGTPAKSMYLVIDTGSDILWLQCAPCKNCYQQEDPIFNPSQSSSYKIAGCGTNLCQSLEDSGCKQGGCLYQVDYGDGSFTIGDFGTDIVTLESTTNGGPGVTSTVPIGCGHDNEGYFVGAAGLLGLGKGPLSFPSQVGPFFGNKFSYCLVDRETDISDKSTIVFGDSAVPSGVKFTPMVSNQRVGTFYYLDMTGISVGGTALSIPTSTFQLDPSSGNGGVIIDSGTSVTRLVYSAYTTMRDAFRAGTGNLPSTAGFSLFDTCYDLTGRSSVDVPTITLHFQNGVDVDLPASNYLIPVDNANTYCFAFAGTSGPSIIGNVQQQGFRIVYDNEKNQVGFIAGQCS